ncbi:MAG: hypothetical protein ACJA1A_003172 [Saprospiraceae bacterium]|jgi:uncharacterized protein YdhG (YjbR/CyaY superfamily)
MSKYLDIEGYIADIPEDRVAPFMKLKETIKSNLPSGFEECLSYNMLGYVVPRSTYPDGYHCDTKLPLPFINIANQKGFIALYHMGIYANPELYDWFIAEYPKHSKFKLDMGKSCIRFKKVDHIPYDLIAELIKKMTVKDWIILYEEKLKN